MERSISQFFGRILLDKRVKVWHVGTYLALVLLWDKNRQSSPFPVTRQTIMHLSRTKSTATYHKYLKELESFGYIRYVPSHHPRQGSQVWIVE